MQGNMAFVGLGFGDEGKGKAVDYYGRKLGSEIVVRYGAPQAIHGVVLPSGLDHQFSQLGSATFAGCKTLISRYMVVDPLRMWNEADMLAEKGIERPLERVTIDARCVLVTPIHRIVNRMREIARGNNRHGSCGLGVGEAIRDSRSLGTFMLTVGDLADAGALKEKLKYLWCLKLDIAEQLCERGYDPQLNILCGELEDLGRLSKIAADLHAFACDSGVNIVDDAYQCILESRSPLIFEGSQGILLDIHRGFYPYVTKSDVSLRNVEDISRRLNMRVKRVGVLRAYMTRHGAGPFVSEDEDLTSSLPDTHNVVNEWQGPFRVGWFDLVATRYALEAVGGVDQIFLTNIDRLNGFGSVKVCVAYDFKGFCDAAILDRYFEWQRQRDGTCLILSLRCPSVASIEYQTELAVLLGKCNPIYLELPLNFQGMNINQVRESYVRFIENELGVRIATVSYGPTWIDTHER